MFQVTDAWLSAFPEAHAGVLAMHGVSNPPHHAGLEGLKQRLQSDLRARFAGGDRRAIEALEPIRAYNAFYKRFKKTYHVQLQLESIVFKNKEIPSVAALVEAMFLAEVKNTLLTAGHDLDLLRFPVEIDVSTGNERYTLLRGQEQVLKVGDMFMSDQDTVISSVLYGPDQRTQITAGTQNVLFAVYAPVGIAELEVYQHLHDIRDNVLLIAPTAQVGLLKVYGSQEG